MNNVPKNCFLCKEQAEVEKDHARACYYVDCKTSCGYYWIDGKLATELHHMNSGKATQQSINCGHFLQEFCKQNSSIPFLFYKEDETTDFNRNQSSDSDVYALNFQEVSSKLVNHSEKPFFLLKEISNSIEYSHAFQRFRVTPRMRTASYIINKSELDRILNYLEKDKSYITIFHSSKDPNLRVFEMTMQGWEALEKHYQQRSSNQAFIAMQFNWEDNKEKDEVLKQIQLACADCGYEANIVRDDHTDYITDKILNSIKKSKFVIAEFTYNNRGAYFEAGYARGLGLEVFHIIKEDHIKGDRAEDRELHFDIRQIRYLAWKGPNEIRSKLSEWIESTVGNYNN